MKFSTLRPRFSCLDFACLDFSHSSDLSLLLPLSNPLEAPSSHTYFLPNLAELPFLGISPFLCTLHTFLITICLFVFKEYIVFTLKFFWPHLWHVEVHRDPTCVTAATWIFNPQHRLLNRPCFFFWVAFAPLSKIN